MSEAELTNQLVSPCLSAVSSWAGEVLCISDTTELNYESKRGRIKDASLLGLVGNGSDLGYLMHPTLCVGASGGPVLGVGDLELLHRTEKKGSRTGKIQSRQLFEEKESSRWLKSCQRVAKEMADDAARSRLTFIADREGDIYNVLAGIEALGSRYVIRSHHNRSVDGGCLLSDVVAGFGSGGTIELDIRATPKRAARKDAELSVRWGTVSLTRPRREATAGLVKSLPVYVVEVVESAATVPEGEKGIHWRLLTNIPVESLEDAVRVLERYRCRWIIEELFKILKSGFGLEDCELESAAGIRKLGVMTLHGAVRILQLRQSRQGGPMPATTCFSTAEVKCLTAIGPKLEGKTEKLKNPFTQHSLAWAYWIIARLGGWKGYDNASKPGILTLWEGLKAFDTAFFTWSLFVQDV